MEAIANPPRYDLSTSIQRMAASNNLTEFETVEAILEFIKFNYPLLMAHPKNQIRLEQLQQELDQIGRIYAEELQRQKNYFKRAMIQYSGQTEQQAELQLKLSTCTEDLSACRVDRDHLYDQIALLNRQLNNVQQVIKTEPMVHDETLVPDNTLPQALGSSRVNVRTPQGINTEAEIATLRQTIVTKDAQIVALDASLKSMATLQAKLQTDLDTCRATSTQTDNQIIADQTAKMNRLQAQIDTYVLLHTKLLQICISTGLFDVTPSTTPDVFLQKIYEFVERYQAHIIDYLEILKPYTREHMELFKYDLAMLRTMRRNLNLQNLEQTLEFRDLLLNIVDAITIMSSEQLPVEDIAKNIMSIFYNSNYRFLLAPNPNNVLGKIPDNYDIVKCQKSVEALKMQYTDLENRILDMQQNSYSVDDFFFKLSEINKLLFPGNRTFDFPESLKYSLLVMVRTKNMFLQILTFMHSVMSKNTSLLSEQDKQQLVTLNSNLVQLKGATNHADVLKKLGESFQIIANIKSYEKFFGSLLSSILDYINRYQSFEFESNTYAYSVFHTLYEIFQLPQTDSSKTTYLLNQINEFSENCKRGGPGYAGAGAIGVGGGGYFGTGESARGAGLSREAAELLALSETPKTAEPPPTPKTTPPTAPTLKTPTGATPKTPTAPTPKTPTAPTPAATPRHEYRYEGDIEMGAIISATPISLSTSSGASPYVAASEKRPMTKGKLRRFNWNTAMLAQNIPDKELEQEELYYRRDMAKVKNTEALFRDLQKRSDARRKRAQEERTKTKKLAYDVGRDLQDEAPVLTLEELEAGVSDDMEMTAAEVEQGDLDLFGSPVVMPTAETIAQAKVPVQSIIQEIHLALFNLIYETQDFQTAIRRLQGLQFSNEFFDTYSDPTLKLYPFCTNDFSSVSHAEALTLLAKWLVAKELTPPDPLNLLDDESNTRTFGLTLLKFCKLALSMVAEQYPDVLFIDILYLIQSMQKFVNYLSERF